MQIKLTCGVCHEEFKITYPYIENKESIICPNCENKMSDEAFKLLKSGISDIAKASELCTSGSGINEKVSFEIRFSD